MDRVLPQFDIYPFLFLEKTLIVFSHDFYDEAINNLVNSVDFASGNSDYLVTSGRDRAVKIWHWRSKTVKLNIDLRKYGRGTGLLLLTITFMKYQICCC